MDALLIGLIVLAADQVPADDDVVAGGWGAAVLVGLLIALAVLGWSLSKHLRKAQAASDAGIYDEPASQAKAEP